MLPSCARMTLIWSETIFNVTRAQLPATSEEVPPRLAATGTRETLLLGAGLALVLLALAGRRLVARSFRP